MTTRNLFNEILAVKSAQRTEKQQRIVEAAIRLFAEKGYSNTSTAEIAKAADVSEASIFKQYGTKDKLLLSLVVPYIKEMFPYEADETMNQVFSGAYSDFEAFLRALLKNRIAFITENRDIFLVLIKEIIYKEELKNELFPYIAEVAATRLTKIVELFQERDELADMPTRSILKLLFTVIGGFVASRFVLLNRESIEDEEVEDVVRMVLDGIRKLPAKNS
ncbi:TetR/AcrR family transcriptional regulator [Cohnella sp. LGH]|uniref:TetR/AcrR family transcriptional regulator n=1 Tax=Cohnella sp. LGH TaxID=1619153 RepID=UPI001ADA56BD|nr:TetR/AcrR family transcriptional regulator [Cohnella sp. LGH]QTH43267.1 TetR/AcrR family transcriptional regulator [Cohnella sp. LGH]